MVNPPGSWFLSFPQIRNLALFNDSKVDAKEKKFIISRYYKKVLDPNIFQNCNLYFISVKLAQFLCVLAI